MEKVVICKNQQITIREMKNVRNNKEKMLGIMLGIIITKIKNDQDGLINTLDIGEEKSMSLIIGQYKFSE